MQLRNLINRRNIGKAKSVTSHVNEIEDFLELCIQCHLITAALQFFSMKSLTDSPHSNGFPSDVQKLSSKKRETLLLSKLETLVDEYVLPHRLHSDPATVTAKEAEQNPHLIRIRAEHSYVPSPAVTNRSLPTSISSVVEKQHAPPSVKETSDGIFNYASAILNDGLLLLEFKDAIREGDGDRILRCWKAFLIYFDYARHTNYRKEAFDILAQTSAAASPQVASQLKWSRVVNTRGGKGKYTR